jgi:ribosome-associated protein
MMPAATPTPFPSSLQAACRALDDKKAEEIRVLHVARQSSITDYLILATGTSEPHLRALRAELDRILGAGKVRVSGEEGGEASGWQVIDAFDFMVHLFTRDMRQHYRLDVLWGDGATVPLETILAPEAPPPAPTSKPTVRKTTAKKAPAPKAPAKKAPAKKAAAKKPSARKAAPRKKT